MFGKPYASKRPGTTECAGICCYSQICFPMAKVLITDDVHPLLIKGLQERGYAVDFLPQHFCRRNTGSFIANYTGLIINSKIFCGEELLR
jgi:hypothetical protein